MLVLFLVVMVIDLILPFAVALPYKGYSHKNAVMSVLGCKKSPLKVIYNLWTIISGFIFVVFGYYMFSFYGEIELSLGITIMLLLVLYGLGDEVLSGMFPVNENREDMSLSSKVHGAGSVIGFIALQFVPLILGILQFRTNEVAHGVFSIVFFVLSLAAFTFFVIGEKPKFKDTVFSYGGLWQRVSLALMYVPLAIWIIDRL